MRHTSFRSTWCTWKYKLLRPVHLRQSYGLLQLRAPQRGRRTVCTYSPVIYRVCLVIPVYFLLRPSEGRNCSYWPSRNHCFGWNKIAATHELLELPLVLLFSKFSKNFFGFIYLETFSVMQINNCPGDPTDMSAKTKPGYLLQTWKTLTTSVI